jgi:peptidoglycan/xylan/chitin deacetylase (PgdA/CDA1 family)
VKKPVINIIKRIATLRPIFNLLYKKDKVVPVLMYHGISDFDVITPEILEEHFEWISKNFTSYFASEINNINSKFDTYPIILTFDDGLKNNKKYVEPLLKKYNLKATFYIVSGLLSGNDYLWNHEFLIRLESLSLDLRVKKFGADAEDAASFVRSLKLRPQDETSELLKLIRELTPDFSATSDQQIIYQIMSSEEIINLDKDHIEIGAHTDTHPILNQLSIEDAIDEILTSKKKLEKLLDRQVNSFCYPNGDYREELIKIISSNFTNAMTTEPDLMDFEAYTYSEIPRLIALPNFLDFKFNFIKPTK